MRTRMLRDDSGAVAILFAIVFVVLVGISALAVDVGYWYTCKRQLQAAADAAALAGCQELIQEGSVVPVVNDYAARNFRTPLDASESRVSDVEVGDDYVKVTLETDANVFLARFFFRHGTALINAQSVAKVGWLAGGKGPVPWGLTILNIEELAADMGGETIGLAQDADGAWSGSFSPGRTGVLGLHATNSIGFEEDYPGLTTVASLPSSGLLAGVDVDKSCLTSGLDTSVHVTVNLSTPLPAGEKITADLGGAKKEMTAVATTQYECDLGVPTTGDSFETVPLHVSAGTGKTAEEVTVRLMLRRASFIFQEVEVHPVAARPTDTVWVSVAPLDFRYGVQYQLKVEGGTGTTGNYQALDFATLNHSGCGYPDLPEPGQSGGADYKQNIIGNTDLVAHLGDFVTTLPGDKVGPTNSGVDERLGGYPVRTFDQWVSAGKPSTKQLCIIPICEKTEDTGGRSVLKIVSFATFFLESPPSGNGPVVGRFIEWTAPGWFVVDDKPSDMAVAAVHLTDDNLDF